MQTWRTIRSVASRWPKWLYGVALLLPTPAEAADSPCLNRGTSLLVITKEHALWACKDSKAVTNYAVAIGSGGVGKTREGDRRTPLGTYALGTPRRSKSFGVFVPIGYPNPEQRKAGLTGGDVGLHGPSLESLDVLTAATDWTDGCIALRASAQAHELAKWIIQEHVSTISIE